MLPHILNFAIIESDSNITEDLASGIHKVRSSGTVRKGLK